jgi:NUMOD3 motif
MIFTKSNPPQHHYIYAYIRSKDSDTAPAGTPYYIGKGYSKRAWAGNHRVPMPTDEQFIVILEHNLTEMGALALERRLIAWYGRKDLGTGILSNMTDGGDGGSGAKRSDSWKEMMRLVHLGKKLTDEQKAAVSATHKGKPWTEARRAAYLANKDKPRKPHSAETKAKISAANAGRTVSEEIKLAHSARMKGRKFGPPSDATKAKISAALKGIKLGPMSEEGKLRRSLTLKGRPSPTKGKPAWNRGMTKAQIEQRTKQP